MYQHTERRFTNTLRKIIKNKKQIRKIPKKKKTKELNKKASEIIFIPLAHLGKGLTRPCWW